MSFDDDLHPRWTALLRWVTVVLLLVGFAGIVARGWIADVELRRSLLNLHRSAGLAVLLVTLLRIATTPARSLLQALLTRGLRVAGVALHVAIYLSLVATPLLGWALTSARGYTALFLGAIPLPAILPNDLDLGMQLQWMHDLSAALLVIFVVLYSASKLWRRSPQGSAYVWRWSSSRRGTHTL